MSLWICSNRQATAVDRDSCSGVADVLRTSLCRSEARIWAGGGRSVYYSRRGSSCSIDFTSILDGQLTATANGPMWAYSPRQHGGAIRSQLRSSPLGRATVGEVLGELIFFYKSDDVRSVLKRRPFVSGPRGTKTSGTYSGASSEPE